MFDYTRGELILNSLADVTVLDSTEDPGLKDGDTALFIKRYGKFAKSAVTGTFKNVGYAPVKEVATIALAGLTLADLTGKVIRLSLDSRLSGSSAGAYSRWDINQGRPTFAEYYVASTPASAAALATALAASFNKALAPYPDVVITASTTNLVITANDEYKRLQGVALETVGLIPDTYTGEVATNLLVAGTITTAGKEGFGTSWFITKNIQLPTVENIRFQGTLLDERPVANSIYDQYTIYMEVVRNIYGQSAVGQLITSKTIHTIYVLASQSAAFQTLLTEAFGAGSVVVAKTGVVANP